MQEQQYISEQGNSNEDEASLDIRYIFYILMRRWWIIVVCAVVSGAVAAGVSYYYLKPEYSSSATMFVYRKTDNAMLVFNDMVVGSQIVKDSVVLLKSELVLKQALLNAGSKISPVALASKITVTSEKDTRVLRISVIDGNPEMAAKLTNEISEAYLEVFKSLTFASTRYSSANEDYINVVDKASPNPNPIKPNKQMNTLIGLLLGAAVGAGIIFLIEYLDDTIKSPETIKLHHNLDVLGVIPTFDNK